MASLADDLFDVSQIDAGHLGGRAPRSSTLGLILEQWRRMPTDARSGCGSVTGADEVRRRWATSARIWQVVTNLVSNAPEVLGGRDRRATWPSSGSAARWSCSSSTEGPGIPADRCPGCSTGSPGVATAGQVPGTGIGLVHRPVAGRGPGRAARAGHGRRVKGSTFIVRAAGGPCRRERGGRHACGCSSSTTMPSSDRRSRRLLGESGITQVDEPATGPAALAVAGDHEYDLILLDLVMPGRSGIELLPDLQERAPTARIVVLSNLPRRMLDEIVQQRGAVGFVEKRVPRPSWFPRSSPPPRSPTWPPSTCRSGWEAPSSAAGDARRFVRTSCRSTTRCSRRSSCW